MLSAKKNIDFFFCIGPTSSENQLFVYIIKSIYVGR